MEGVSFKYLYDYNMAVLLSILRVLGGVLKSKDKDSCLHLQIYEGLYIYYVIKYYIYNIKTYYRMYYKLV